VSFPPALVRLRLVLPQWPRISLWLPVFLLWPLLLLLLPLAALAACSAAVLPARFAALPHMVSSLYAVICAARGTHIDVSGGQEHVLVEIH
jgi:hypothetical protein